MQQHGLYLLKLKDVSFISPATESEFKDYYKFRWQQLRQPLDLPIGSERDEFEDASFHCAAIAAPEGIIGIGRISPEPHPSCPDKQMRIRYMAVADDYRSRGIGSMIVEKLLLHAQANNVTRCWLNARSDAVPFYEKNGFKVVKSIETDLAIAHFEMEIYLKP